MDSEVLAALLGALVGGLASGLAALGGSLLVERMKLRKSTRIRMYEEMLPQIRDATSGYLQEISQNARLFQFRYGLDYSADDLEHIGVMAGRRERQLASRIGAGFRKNAALWAESHNYTVNRAGGTEWVGDRTRLQALFEGIAKDIAALEVRLRKKID